MTGVLITGGSGLLGSSIAHRASDQYENVITTYLSRPIDYDGVNCQKVDLTNRTNIQELAECNADAVIHCAAMTDVDQCELKPHKAEYYNVVMSKHVARLAAQMDARLIHISTDAVFDGRDGNYKYNDETNPVNVYGQTKLNAESAIQRIHNDSIIIRTSIYGWNEATGQSLAEWMLSRLREGETLPAFEDAYFSPIYTGDLAECLLEVIDNNFNGIYHIAGRDRCSKLEFANAIAEVFELDADLIQPASIKDIDFDAPRGEDLSLSTNRAQNLLECSLPALRKGIDNMRNDE